MAESSSHNLSSPKITPKEEPVTLDKPESPNPFLPADQIEFTFKEIAFTTKNEVALLYPSHPNSEYFREVSDFISKCCLKEAFIRAPTQYKEYLSRIRGDICINTFKNALRAHYLPYSTKETQSSSAKDKRPSHPSPPTPVVGEMHKEAQQAAGGPAYLGATSKDEAYPQLSRHDASADSTAEADPGLFAPNDSISSQQDQTKSAGDGLKTTQTDLGTNEESKADEISKKIKLVDLSDFLKDTRSAFFTPDSPQDEPIIVLDESEEEEEVAKDKDTYASSHNKDELEQQKEKVKVASLKARSSFPDINQLTNLLVTSLKPELSKLLASHNFASCLPSELKELPSKFTKLSREIKELKLHVKDMEIELPGDLKEIPTKLETFTSTIFGATTKDVPSAGQATASPAKGEKNTTKDAKINLQNELVNLLCFDVVEQYHNNKLLFDKYCDKMLKRRKSSKIINCDVITQKGPITLKVYREDGTVEVIANFKVSDLHLAEWREVVQACPDRKDMD
ncbi:hypothetical protein Tco_0742013 [Tanacetum coccineum]